MSEKYAETFPSFLIQQKIIIIMFYIWRKTKFVVLSLKLSFILQNITKKKKKKKKEGINYQNLKVSKNYKNNFQLYIIEQITECKHFDFSYSKKKKKKMKKKKCFFHFQSWFRNEGSIV